MPEVNQYMFKYSEVLEALIKKPACTKGDGSLL